MGGGGGGGSSLVLKNVINWGVPDACRTRVQQMRGKRSGQEKCTRTKKKKAKEGVGGASPAWRSNGEATSEGLLYAAAARGPSLLILTVILLPRSSLGISRPARSPCLIHYWNSRARCPFIVRCYSRKRVLIRQRHAFISYTVPVI